MKKAIKYLFITLFSLILIIILAAVGLMFFVNPNHFKNDISQQVYKMTGRTLSMNGDLKWSFFPAVGLQVNQAVLSNAPNFGTQPFADVGQAIISIKLMPLFSGKVEADTLSLTDVTLNLIKNSSGQNNWQDLTNSTNANSTIPAINNEPVKSAKPMTITLNKVTVNNMVINYQNGNEKQLLIIHQLQGNDFNLAGKAFPLMLDLQFSNLNQKQPLDITFKAQLSLDTEKQTFNTKEMQIKANNMNVQADLSAQQIMSDAINYQGTISVPSFSAADFIQSFSDNVHFTNAQALRKVSTNFSFSGDAHSLQIPDFKASIDSSNIQGDVSLNDLPRLIGHFNLSADKINLDNYQTAKASASNNNQAITTSSNQVANSTAYTVPFNHSNLNGKVVIDSLTVENAEVNNFSTSLNVQNGVVTIGPMHAEIYSGQLRANLVADYTSPVAAYNVSETLTNVQINPLLMAVTNKNIISGLANLNANLSMRGNDNTSLLRSLKGTAGFSFQNGTLQGFDFLQAINTAASVFFRQPNQNAGNDSVTSFANASATLQINNGVVNTSDLTLSSPMINLTGEGSVDLVTQGLNLSVKVNTIGDSIPQVAKLEAAIGGSIPLKVTGTLNHPQIAPDMQAITIQATKNKVGQQIEKLGNSLNETGRDIGKQLKSIFQ